jgi:hypothetical protein
VTHVGILGICLSAIAFFFAPFERSKNRIVILFVAWVLHITSAFVYYYYAQSHVTDAWGYYYDPHDLYRAGISLGSWCVFFVVHFLRELIGGTFLDYFLLFQAAGFWGVAVLMRTMEEVYARFALKPADVILSICWLPGLHFWTSGIGKDPLLFLACSLAVWSVMAPRKRWPSLAAALGIMLMFRAHIALVAVIALAGATFLNKRKSAGQWLALGVLAAGIVVAVVTVRRALVVDVTSVQSVSDFVEARSSVNRTVGGATAVFAPFPVRVLSLLFRPFFFDAREAFGIISSLENVAMLFVVAKVTANWQISKNIASDIFAVRFWWFFTFALVLLLGFMYYNVGLGLRQRTMFMPPLIAAFVTVLAIRKGRAAFAVECRDARGTVQGWRMPARFTSLGP